MGESGGADRRGIGIPDEVARSVGLPDDLDADAPVDYAIPDTARRRRAGYVYIVAAGVFAGGALGGLGSGYWFFTLALILVAVHHAASGVTLEIRERHALDVANRATSFTAGHVSATVGFEGFLSRPVWNVLMFSADDPPSQRGLVRVDGLTGEVRDTYVEAIDGSE